MESLLPSEIARLVYGYLEAEKCWDAASQFLKTSQHLQECYQFYLHNGKFSTKVMGFTLLQCLELLCSVYRIVQHHISLLENDTVERYSLPEQIEFLLTTKDRKNGDEENNAKISNQVSKKTPEKEEDSYSLKPAAKPKCKALTTLENPSLSESSSIFTSYPLSVDDDDLDQVFPIPETTSLESLPGTTKVRRKSPVKSKNEDFWTDNGSINGAPVDVTLFQKPFLEKPELPTKIAETINKALKTPEKPRSKGKGKDKAKDKDRGKSAGEQLDSVIKTVVNQMVDKDPAFDDVLAEIIGKMDLPNNPPPMAPVKEARKSKEMPKPDSAPVTDYSDNDRLSMPDFEPNVQDTPTLLSNRCSSTISHEPNPAMKSNELNFSDATFNNTPALIVTDPAKPLESQVTAPITTPAIQVPRKQTLLPSNEQVIPALQPEVLQPPVESSSIIVVADPADVMESQSLVVQPQYFAFVPAGRGLYSNPADIAAAQSQDFMQNVLIAKEQQLLAQTQIVSDNDSSAAIYVPSLTKRGEFINIAPKMESAISTTAFLMQAPGIPAASIPVPAKLKSRPSRNRPSKNKTKPAAKSQEPMIVEVRILDSVKDAAATEKPSEDASGVSVNGTGVSTDGGEVSAAESYRRLVEAMSFHSNPNSREATPIKSNAEIVNAATADQVEQMDDATNIAYTLDLIVNEISNSIPGTPNKMSDEADSADLLSDQIPTTQKLGDQKQENESHLTSISEKVRLSTITSEIESNRNETSDKIPDVHLVPAKTLITHEKSSTQMISEKMSGEIAASEDPNNSVSLMVSENSLKIYDKSSNFQPQPEKINTNQSLAPKIVETNQILPESLPINLSKETSEMQSIAEEISFSQNLTVKKVPEIPPKESTDFCVEHKNKLATISEKSPEEVAVGSNEVIPVESLVEEKSSLPKDKVPINNEDAGQFFSTLKLENKLYREQDAEKMSKNLSILDKSHSEACDSVTVDTASTKSNVSETDKANDFSSRIERIFSVKCDSVSPIRVTNTQRQSLSTPRRKKSHVRALDFSTPKNFKDQFKRKANTSPKAVQASGPLRDRVKSVRRSELFQSPTSPVLDTATETTWHFASVSQTQNNENKCPDGVKTPQGSRIRSITSPLSSIKEEPSLGEESTTDSFLDRPPLTIATRPPLPKLSGGWDKVNGVGLIVGSPKHPTPQKSLDIDPNSVSNLPKVELKSWDASLRAMLGSHEEEEPETPKKNLTPKSVPKKSEANELHSSTPKAKLTPKKRGKKVTEKKSPVKKKIKAVTKSKNKSPLKVDFSATPAKVPVMSILNMPEFTPNKAETSKCVLDTKTSPGKIEVVGMRQKPAGTSESDESVAEYIGIKRKARKAKSSEQVLEPTRTSRRIETRKKNRQAMEKVATPPKKTVELRCVVSPGKNTREPTRQSGSPLKEMKKVAKIASSAKETKEPTNQPPSIETENSLEQTEFPLKETKEFTQQPDKQMLSVTEEANRPVTEIVSPLETKEIEKEGKPKKPSRGRRKKNSLPSPDSDWQPIAKKKMEDQQCLKIKLSKKGTEAENPEKNDDQKRTAMALLKKDDSEDYPGEIPSTFSPSHKDDLKNEASSAQDEGAMEPAPKKRRVARSRKVEDQLPIVKSESSSANQCNVPSPPINSRRGRGRPKKISSPKEEMNVPRITSAIIEKAADQIVSAAISPEKSSKKRGRKAVPKKVSTVQESTDEEIGIMILDDKKFIYTVAEIHAEGCTSDMMIHSDKPNQESNESQKLVVSGALKYSESESGSAVDKFEEGITLNIQRTPEKCKTDFTADDKSIDTEKSEGSIMCEEKFCDQAKERKGVETSIKIKSSSEKSPAKETETKCVFGSVNNKFSNKSESKIVSDWNFPEHREAEILVNQHKISEKSEMTAIFDHQNNCCEKLEVKKKSRHKMQNLVEYEAKIMSEGHAANSRSEMMVDCQSAGSKKSELEILLENQSIVAKSEVKIISDDQGVKSCADSLIKSQIGLPNRENVKLHNVDNRVEIIAENPSSVTTVVLNQFIESSVSNTVKPRKVLSMPLSLPPSQIQFPFSMANYSEEVLDLRVRENIKLTEIGTNDKQDFSSLISCQKDGSSCDSSEKVVLYAATPEPNDLESQSSVQASSVAFKPNRRLSNLSAFHNVNMDLSILTKPSESSYHEPISKEVSPQNVASKQSEKTLCLSDSSPEILSIITKPSESSYHESILKELSPENCAFEKSEKTLCLTDSSAKISDKPQSNVTETIKNNTTGNIICTSNQLLHNMIHTSHDENSTATTILEVDSEANEKFLSNFRLCVEYELDNGMISHAIATVSDLSILLDIPSKDSGTPKVPVKEQKAIKIEEIKDDPEISLLTQQEISAAESSLFDEAILTGRPKLAETSESFLSQTEVGLETPKNSIVERILAEISASSSKSAHSKLGPKRILTSKKMSTISPKNQASAVRLQHANDARSISPFPLAKSPIMNQATEKSKVKPRHGQNLKSPSDTKVSFGAGSKRYDGRWTSDMDFKSFSAKGRKNTVAGSQCSRKECFIGKQSAMAHLTKNSIKLSPQKRSPEDSFKVSPQKRSSEGSTSHSSPQKQLGGGSAPKRSPRKMPSEYRGRNPPPRSPSPEEQLSKDDSKHSKERVFVRSPSPSARHSRNHEHHKRSFSPEQRHARDKIWPLSGERKGDHFGGPPLTVQDEKGARHSWDKNEKCHRNKGDRDRSSSPEAKHSGGRSQVPTQERYSRQSSSPEARRSREKNRKYSGEQQEYSRGSSSGDRYPQNKRPYSGDRRDPQRRSVSVEPRLSHSHRTSKQDHYLTSRHKPQNWSHKGKVYRRLPSPEDRYSRDTNQRGKEPRYSDQYSSNWHAKKTRQHFHKADSRKYSNRPGRPENNRKRKRNNFKRGDRLSRSAPYSPPLQSFSSMKEEDKCTLKRLGLWNKFLKLRNDKSVRTENLNEEEYAEQNVKTDARDVLLCQTSEMEDGEVSWENSMLNHGAEADSQSTTDDHDVELKGITSKKRKIEDSSDENTSTSILDKRMKCGSIEALMNVNIPEFLSKIHPSEKE